MNKNTQLSVLTETAAEALFDDRVAKMCQVLVEQDVCERMLRGKRGHWS